MYLGPSDECDDGNRNPPHDPPATSAGRLGAVRNSPRDMSHHRPHAEADGASLGRRRLLRSVGAIGTIVGAGCTELEGTTTGADRDASGGSPSDATDRTAEPPGTSPSADEQADATADSPDRPDRQRGDRFSYRFDAGNRGLPRGPALSPPFEQVWSVDPPTAPADVTAITADHVLATVGEDRLLVLETATGEVRTEIGLEAGLDPDYRPAVAGDEIYVADEGRDLVRFDARTGERTWTVRAEERFHGFPTVSEETVYAGSRDRGFYAIDRDSGDVRWRAEVVPGFGHAAVGDAVYVNTYRNVVRLEATSGSVVWDTDFETADSVTTPAVADGTVYLGVGDGSRKRYLAALDAATGDPVWELDREGRMTPTEPCVHESYVVAADSIDGEMTLFAADRETGTLVWETPLEDRLVAAPFLLEGTIYVADTFGTLHGFDVESGDRLWRYDLNRYRGVRVLTHDGVLVAYRQADERLVALTGDRGAANNS